MMLYVIYYTAEEIPFQTFFRLFLNHKMLYGAPPGGLGPGGGWSGLGGLAGGWGGVIF